MEILKKLGITPEEFLDGFQKYLKSLPDNDEIVTVLPSGRTWTIRQYAGFSTAEETVTRNQKGLVVDDPGTGSHFKNYTNLLISQNRDDKLDYLLK